MLNLPNVTLLAVSSVDIEDTVKALSISSKGINFGSVKFISHEKPSFLPDHIEYEFIEKIDNIDTWNYNIIYNLTNYVKTDFCILIHADGFIVNPDSWREDFLNYDYIGAPWGHNFYDKKGNQIRVGNSVSLRSKKLLEIPKKFNMPFLKHWGNYNEGTQICVHNRELFIENGVNFATYEVAKYFSHETRFEDFKNIKPFCFHSLCDKPEYQIMLDNHSLLKLEGIEKINDNILYDNRGYFLESSNEKHNMLCNFKQDNISCSKKNVVRGMHYQWGPPSQGKLVRVIKGKVIDVFLDIRKNSKTYGKYDFIELHENCGYSIWIPPGFAHGFLSLEDDTILLYKCSEPYVKEYDSGINPFDQSIKIPWESFGLDSSKLIISEKDLNSKTFAEYNSNPRFQ